MPNWCYTSYVLEGSDKDIKKIDNLLDNLMSRKKPAIENGFGTNWLGCLVNALGGDWQKIPCRGTWSNKERIGNILRLTTDTAWIPLNEVFDFIHEKFPSVIYFYAAEEPGCELYSTNDVDGKYFPERYNIDLYDLEENYDSAYFTTADAVLDYINENYHPATPLKTLEDIDKLDNEWRENSDDAFINYHIVQVYA